MRVRSWLREFAIAMLAICGLLRAQSAAAPAGFTLQQAMASPYSWDLVTAPAGGRAAWLTLQQGRRNLWIAESTKTGYSAHAVTHYLEDDGADMGDVAFSHDASMVAYARGGDLENPDKAAPNPAELEQGNETSVYIVRLGAEGTSAAPERVASGHAPIFSFDGKVLYFLRGGTIYSIDIVAKDAKPKQLISLGGKQGTLRLSPDGTWLLFVSRRESHSFLGVVDLRTHVLAWLAPSSGKDMLPVWSPDSKRIAFVRVPWFADAEFSDHHTAPLGWQMWVATLSQDKETPVEAHAVYIAEAGTRGSAWPDVDGLSLLWAADDRLIAPAEFDGWLHLYGFRANAPAVQTDIPIPAAKQQAPTLLTPGDFEAESPALSPDGTTLVYASNQVTDDARDQDRRHLWRVALTERKPPVALTHGEGIETRPAFTHDSALLCLQGTVREPMHASIVAANGIKPVSPDSTLNNDAAAHFVTPQQVIFPADDGVKLHGQLFLPPSNTASQKHPAIVFFHGGSRRQMLLGYPAMDYYSNAYVMNQYLASRGYIVLSVNYRSGTGYGQSFREAAGYGASGGSEMHDVRGAALYLRSRVDVDPAKIGAWGGSWGGYLAAMALARASDLYAAGVDISGVHDWNVEFGANSGTFDATGAEDPGRTLAYQQRAFESSPMASIATWRSPVLFVHGDDDPDVAFHQTPLLASVLRQRGVPVEELIFPDEVHDFLLQRHWMEAYEAAARFFERRLSLAR